MTAWYHQHDPTTPTYRCPTCSATVVDTTAHERWHEAMAANR